ncbi:helicase-associated domain-containing protein [Corynebacterium qintianiae]|uniref:helicase-associated domain-containing protein n=1 Tax=Corynebacterium qintianiae TaxID=2709392 RepID=UPI0013EB870C|nr:helicase-associated domain-containing protein [Corynebacterium qintianiae]
MSAPLPTPLSTLLSALSEMGDAELRELIRVRPNATFPAPPSLASLATRLTLPGSVARALRRLTAADIALLETLGDMGAELDPVPLSSINLPFQLAGPLNKLRSHALLLGPDDGLRVAPGVLSALPSGWRILDPAPDNLAEALSSISPRERQVLETLAASGSIGTTRGAAPDADPDLPVPRLISRGLLARVNTTTVRLPRPVREMLRGAAVRTYPLEPHPPSEPVEQSLIDATSTAAGLESVRQMRQLLTHLIAAPVELNKDGSVGVRAVAALTKALGFDPSLTVTVGESAGLLGRGDVGEDTGALAATRDGLSWMDSPLAQQWAVLVVGWLASPWRADSGARLLSEETRAPEIRSARWGVVKLFAPGPLSRDDLDADLHHFSPILAAGMSPQLISAVVREGHLVGALAENSAAAPLTALIEGKDIVAATRDLVPDEVDYLIPQADMTILAPGPLTPEMTAVIESFADLESPGVASVYRVTASSVRRALNSGRTGPELKAWLGAHAVGEVPQGITFAIDDAARHHGALRAGTALSYLRSDDEALIASAAAAIPQLSVLSPTVAVSQLPLPELMALLRACGFQPAAEDESGAALTVAPEPQLVAPTPSTIPRERAVDPEHVDAVLQALRSTAGSETDGGDFLPTLHAAARSRRHVTIGYVDKNGRGQQLTVLPLSVTAGQVDALDEATERVVRIALPRVTKVELT